MPMQSRAQTGIRSVDHIERNMENVRFALEIEERPMIQRDLENAAYAKIVARAWSDPAFKENLLAEPAAVLAAAGVAVPADLTVKLVEDTDQLVHLVLPAPPAEDELSDEALDNVAGGWCCYCTPPELPTCGPITRPPPAKCTPITT
jgi:hypothetical protein